MDQKAPSKHIVIDARIRRSSTGRYADRLLEHLQTKDEHNRYTILLQVDDPWQPRAANFSVHHVRYKQFSFNPLDQIGFSALLYRLKPDVVHFTMTQQPIFYFGRIVSTTHDLTMLHYTRRTGGTPLPFFLIKKLGYRFLLWWGHRKSTALIVPTEYVKQDVVAYHPFTANKITVTYEATEPPMQQAGIQPKGGKEPFIMYAGSGFPHKNLEQLIRAFELLHAQMPALTLVLTGKKEFHYEQVEKFADANPARPSILFTGFVSDEELKWLYEHTSVYVFPSVSEGFGLPGLEAMAHGAPVASSNATCLPEVYGDAAHYFDPHNPKDMAEKIKKVLDDTSLRQQLIQSGYQQIKKYSWERMAQQTLDVYQRVLDSKA